MFRTGKRWLIVCLSSISPLIPAAFGFYLKVIGDKYSYAVAGVVFLALLAINFAILFFVHIRPYRDLTSSVLTLLEIVGDRIIAQGKNDGIALRLNVLMIYRPVTRAWRSHFRVRWGIGMKYQPDGAAKFHTSKGVCGEVLRIQRGMLVDLTLPENQDWGFSRKELEKFPAFTAIWSLPIFELDKEGDMTGKVIGTVNLDSTSPNAYAGLTANQDYVELFEEFREVVSKVTS